MDGVGKKKRLKRRRLGATDVSGGGGGGLALTPDAGGACSASQLCSIHRVRPSLDDLLLSHKSVGFDIASHKSW